MVLNTYNWKVQENTGKHTGEGQYIQANSNEVFHKMHNIHG